MARAHVEFIQNQVLPWVPLGAGSARPGAAQRTLSTDSESEALSAIVKYPAGWRMAGPHYLPCDEEFFVLEGRLWVGSVEYGTGDYAYLPAGMPRPGMESDIGATVLTFFEGRHGSVTGEAPFGLYDPARLIAKLSTARMPWGAPSDKIVAAIANAPGRKLLRDDPTTGERTWILSFGPDDPAKMTHGRVETHPVVEEMLLLDGEVQMPIGTLKPGAYFWRPAHKPHGPVGTLKGLVGFFRCKGGPLTTDWSKDERPIPWHAPYDPVLPNALRPLSTQSCNTALPF